MTQESYPPEAKTMLEAGDDEDEIRRILQRAIDEGSPLEGGNTQIAIPVGDELAPWGMSTWYFPGDGSVTRANEFFSGILSQVMGEEVIIFGFGPNVTEGVDQAKTVLFGVVTGQEPQLPVQA